MFVAEARSRRFTGHSKLAHSSPGRVAKAIRAEQSRERERASRQSRNNAAGPKCAAAVARHPRSRPSATRPAVARGPAIIALALARQPARVWGASRAANIRRERKSGRDASGAPIHKLVGRARDKKRAGTINNSRARAPANLSARDSTGHFLSGARRPDRPAAGRVFHFLRRGSRCVAYYIWRAKIGPAVLSSRPRCGAAELPLQPSLSRYCAYANVAHADWALLLL